MSQDQTSPTVKAKRKLNGFITRRSLLALGRLLSGDPANDDRLIKNVYSKIEHGKRLISLSVFSTKAYTAGIDKPFKVAWVKSANGVYAVIKTVTPVYNSKTRLYDLTPSFSVIFSTHPHYLGDFLLWKKDGTPPVNNDEFSRKVSIICTHLARDVELQDKSGYHFSWALKAMNRHKEDYEDRLLTHGTLIVDKRLIYRSGSSIFYTLPNSKDKNLRDVYLYSNPIKGYKGLDVPHRAMDYWLFRSTLKFLSVKLTDQPIEVEDIHEYVRDKFSYISSHMVRYVDPYDLFAPEHRLGRTNRFAQKLVLRTLQSASSTISKLNFKSAIINTIAGGAVVVAFGALGAFYTAGAIAIKAVSAQKTNILLKSFQASFRKMVSFLNVIPTKKPDLYVDYSEAHAYTGNGNLNTELAIGLPLHPSIAQNLEPVPLLDMGHTFLGAKPYTPETEREWAENLILSTKGYAPGTIFIDQYTLGKRQFLKAEQSNGMTVLYDPSAGSAYAHIERTPYEHCCLEVPLKNRFAELDDTQSFVAVRLCPNKGIKSVNLSTIAKAPASYKRTQKTPSPQNTTLDDRTYGMQLAALKSLPPRVRKTMKAHAWKQVQIAMYATKRQLLVEHFKSALKISTSSYHPESTTIISQDDKKQRIMTQEELSALVRPLRTPKAP